MSFSGCFFMPGSMLTCRTSFAKNVLLQHTGYNILYLYLWLQENFPWKRKQLPTSTSSFQLAQGSSCLLITSKIWTAQGCCYTCHITSHRSNSQWKIQWSVLWIGMTCFVEMWKCLQQGPVVLAQALQLQFPEKEMWCMSNIVCCITHEHMTEVMPE